MTGKSLRFTMRKFISAILLISAVILTTCQDSGAVSHGAVNQTTGVADVLAAATADSTDQTTLITETTTEETNPYDIEARLANGAEGVDIDLTVLSANMVYSEVFAMVYAPDEYIGHSSGPSPLTAVALAVTTFTILPLSTSSCTTV